MINLSDKDIKTPDINIITHDTMSFVLKPMRLTLIAASVTVYIFLSVAFDFGHLWLSKKKKWKISPPLLQWLV